MTSKAPGPRPKGETPKSGEWVSGPGGPTMTQGGIMPGGPEMEGWKRPTTDEYNLDDDLSIEEQAENLKDRIDK